MRSAYPAPALEHVEKCDGTDCDYDYCQAQGMTERERGALYLRFTPATWPPGTVSTNRDLEDWWLAVYDRAEAIFKAKADERVRRERDAFRAEVARLTKALDDAVAQAGLECAAKHGYRAAAEKVTKERDELATRNAELVGALRRVQGYITHTDMVLWVTGLLARIDAEEASGHS
jgi:hypothetical protein